MTGCLRFLRLCVFYIFHEPINCPPVAAGDEVPVDVNGDLDGVVTELVFYLGRAFALLEKETGESMAQVMEPNPPQLGFGESAPENLSQVARIEPGPATRFRLRRFFSRGLRLCMISGVVGFQWQ